MAGRLWLRDILQDLARYVWMRFSSYEVLRTVDELFSWIMSFFVLILEISLLCLQSGGICGL